MKKPSIERVNEEAKKALEAFEKAAEEYKRRTKRHIYAGPIILGKPMPKPEALLDFGAFNDIDKAWRKLEQADGRLRQACIQLAMAHYEYFVRVEDGE